MQSLTPRDWRRGQRGYTLVELVVAMGLSAMVGVMLFAVLMFSITFMRRGASELDTEQLTRIALAHLVRELREAHGGADAVIVWPEVAGEPFQAVGFVSPRQEAPGRPFSIDEYGSPAWQTAIYYVHDAPSGVLWRIARPWDGTFTVPATTEGRVMVRGVKSITINRQEDLVTITLVVSVGRQERRLATAVQLRN